MGHFPHHQKVLSGPIRFLDIGVQGNKLLEDEVSPEKPPYLDLQNKHTLEWL